MHCSNPCVWRTIPSSLQRCAHRICIGLWPVFERRPAWKHATLVQEVHARFAKKHGTAGGGRRQSSAGLSQVLIRCLEKSRSWGTCFNTWRIMATGMVAVRLWRRSGPSRFATHHRKLQLARGRRSWRHRKAGLPGLPGIRLIRFHANWFLPEAT